MDIQDMLLTPNKYSRPGTPIRATHVAWHYVGNPGSSAVANRNYFESLKDSGKTYVSSHYIIGLEGEIIRCIPENEISYCTNSANSYTISIECCHPDSSGKYTQATEQSLVELTADILRRLGQTSNNIIRHYDVTGKICPKYYVDNPSAYNDARQRVAELLGQPAPNPSPSPTPTQKPQIIYAVQCLGRSWYPEVVGTSDYAGDGKNPVVDVMIKTTIGSVKYRVHIAGGGWLPWVTGYSKSDHNNGYAGNHKPIDAVEVYYSTPSSIRPPYRYALYRVAPVGRNYYPWQRDNERGNGMDGYAGAFGNHIGKLQMKID